MAEMKNYGMVQVGISTPGGPGDIWVQESLIAQIGMPAVRQMVRDTYRAAYDSKARNRRFLPPPPASVNGEGDGNG